MNNLTPKEIKAIFLVHNKADYKNVRQINESLKIIKQRKILQSAKALQYKKRLALLCKGKEDYSCVFCKEKNPEGKGVICPECEELLNKLLNGEQIDENLIKDKIKNRKVAKLSKALSLPRGKAIIAVVFSILLLAGSVYLLFSSWATYDDLYQKAMMIPSLNAKQVDMSAKEVKSQGEELFGYIGTKIDNLNNILGESSPMIGENIRYFDAAKVSVVYNTETSMVEYIDIDGLSEVNATLMGVGYGMNRMQAIDTLANVGITEPSSVSDSTYEYYFTDPTETNEVTLAVTFSEDVVTLVSATLK